VGMNIGELSRLTGLSVKTIRYYSDVGLVPETDRSTANYRRYDRTSLARLELVRTLRELGLDIATIRRVLDQGADLAAVAAAHAEAIDAQIRILRLRRAALRAVARHDPSPEEVDRMTRIAQATADERRRIVEQFFDRIFGGVPETPDSVAFITRIRSVTPDLPDDPTDKQVDAWLELAEMLRDGDFQARLHAMAQRTFGSQASGGGNHRPGAGGNHRPGAGGGHGPGGAAATMPTGPAMMRDAEILVERVSAAMDAGVTPSSARAAALVDEIVGPWAATVGRPDDPAYRRELLEQLEFGIEPRAERYWQLLAVINGWPPIPTTIHRWTWFAEALRAHLV
jgi:DNA-binding transcriptional MerR regulator